MRSRPGRRTLTRAQPAGERWRREGTRGSRLGRCPPDEPAFFTQRRWRPEQTRGLDGTVQEFDGEDGDPYVSIGSGCCLPNYFKLKAAVQKKPRPTAGGDGHVTEIQILRGNSIIAKDLRLFSVDGTAADKAFAKLAQGGRFTFWGITRLDLKQILQLVKNHPGEERPVPIEFVLLAVVPSTTH